MPFRTEYFARELHLTWNGVEIYRDYKRDGSGIRYEYHFTTSPEDDASSFDVRELKAFKKIKSTRKTESVRIMRALRGAIDSGEIKP